MYEGTTKTKKERGHRSKKRKEYKPVKKRNR